MGIYDSGRNVSMINSSLLYLKNKNNSKCNNNHIKCEFQFQKNMIALKIKSFDMDGTMNQFVIDQVNFDCDFSIGLYNLYYHIGKTNEDQNI